MNDLFTARAQRNITYAWLIGFFGIITAAGLGYIKDVPYESLFSMTTVVLFFWFQRTRNSSEPQPKGKTDETQT